MTHFVYNAALGLPTNIGTAGAGPAEASQASTESPLWDLVYPPQVLMLIRTDFSQTIN
jgi:hypothetical protein